MFPPPPVSIAHRMSMGSEKGSARNRLHGPTFGASDDLSRRHPVGDASLVAAWGDDIQIAWNELLADQYPWSERNEDAWLDDAARCRVAVVRPREPSRGGGSLARGGTCIAAFEGRLADANPGGADEVIAAYRRWGDDLASHLHGEFAFVL